MPKKPQVLSGELSKTVPWWHILLPVPGALLCGAELFHTQQTGPDSSHGGIRGERMETFEILPRAKRTAEVQVLPLCMAAFPRTAESRIKPLVTFKFPPSRSAPSGNATLDRVTLGLQ